MSEYRKCPHCLGEIEFNSLNDNNGGYKLKCKSCVLER